ncbi:hypothetical protein BN1110_02337 [bacterium YEK0313]|nr:hypothetical protein BN1110_02337 [bacterium YEK0313]
MPNSTASKPALRKLPFAALVAMLLALPFGTSGAAAKDFQLGAPVVATISLPDAWSPNVTERGVEATTADDEIYVAVNVASARNVEDAMKQALAYLVSQGVEIDPSTQRQREMTINGMPTLFLGYSGKDSEGEQAEISVGILIANPETVLILSYWGSKDGEKTYASELGAILQSLAKVQ